MKTTRIQILAHALLFAVVFAALSAALPRRASNEIAHKFDQFAARAAEYDVVFVGSSHVIFMVDPEVFDAEMAARGHPVKSYNMAFEGMSALPANEVLRQVLKVPGARPRWVFAELKPWHPELRPHQLYADRHVWWHSPAATLQACRAAWVWNLDRRETARTLGQHLHHAFLNYWPAGKAFPVLEGLPPSEYPAPGARGFISMEDWFAGRPNAVKSLQAVLQDTAAYKEAVARVAQEARNFARTGEAPPLRESAAWHDFHRAAFAGQIALARRHGAEMAFLYSPAVSNPRQSYTLANFTGDAPVFNFCDPARYPEFFERRNRFELSHLNARGATLYSRAIAHAFADHLDALEGRT